MSYRYEFDFTIVGDFRLDRADYLVLQDGFRSLQKEVDLWNRRALENGALNPPYEREASDLENLIGWGEQELARTSAWEVVIRGASIGSLRYVKAALLLLIKRREDDLSVKTKDGWPSAALSSLTERIDRIRKVARSIAFEPGGILTEVMLQENTMHGTSDDASSEWDVFISHASEDKESFARPLARRLRELGFRVWFDEITLIVGDSLRGSIDRGLARSKFGIVVISPDFFRKNWPQKELDGLVAREGRDAKVILPVWHNITFNQVRAVSPTLADKVAAQSSEGLDVVVTKLLQVIRPEADTLNPVPSETTPATPAKSENVSKAKISAVEVPNRRKAELAEQALTTVYEARDFFRAVRTPAMFRGEGESRRTAEYESDAVKRARDSYSVPIERLQRGNDLFDRMRKLRYAFEAQFGWGSVRAFDDLAEVRQSIMTAASILIETASFEELPGRRNDDLVPLKNTIGWGPGARPDEIDQKIEAAVIAAEKICRPLL